MQCVWVPDDELRMHRNRSSDVGEADMGATVILQSLNDFVPESFGWPPF